MDGPGPANARSHAAAPAFDETPLRRIADQLDSRTAADRFAVGYLRQLDDRVSRVCSALEAGDGSEAMDATLSLKVTSAMVGAIELERLAATVEAHLRGQQTPDARQAGHDLPVAAVRCRDEMRHYLEASPS